MSAEDGDEAWGEGETVTEYLHTSPKVLSPNFSILGLIITSNWNSESLVHVRVEMTGCSLTLPLLCVPMSSHDSLYSYKLKLSPCIK